MSLKKKVVDGIRWNFAGKLGSQIVSIIAVIVLSRLLAPEIFGTIAIAAIFTGLANILISFGIKPIIVQTENLTDEKTDTFFYLYLSIAIISIIILNSFGFLIAEYYAVKGLQTVLFIMSLSIPLNTYNTVQIALLSRDMKFKDLSIRKFISQILALVGVVILSYFTKPYIALAFQSVILSLGSILFLQFVAKWNPRLRFNFNLVRHEISFGKVLFLNNLAAYLSTQVDNLFIGKTYGEFEFGLYQRGYIFIMLPTKFIADGLGNVLNPFYAKIKEEKKRIGKYYMYSYRISSILLGMLLLPVIIEPEGFVLLIFGEQWIEMSEYLRIFAICGYLQGLNSLVSPILHALAEKKLLMWDIVFKRLFLVIAVLVGLQYGIIYVIYARLISDLFNLIVSGHQMFKSIQVTYSDQIMMTLRSTIASTIVFLVLFIAAYFLKNVVDSDVIRFTCVSLISVLTTYLYIVLVKPTFIREILSQGFVSNQMVGYAERLKLITPNKN
ncbi:MAG: hypothetical protein COA58_01620 [Bacteroidetes bacterium]|nr:MAG: hypothetical protein COA58_01620 [Bacteroidota bacterium]